MEWFSPLRNFVCYCGKCVLCHQKITQKIEWFSSEGELALTHWGIHRLPFFPNVFFSLFFFLLLFNSQFQCLMTPKCHILWRFNFVTSWETIRMRQTSKLCWTVIEDWRFVNAPGDHYPVHSSLTFKMNSCVKYVIVVTSSLCV